MQEYQDLAARVAVEDVVVRLFVSTDERDWPALEACFTTPFTLDMTSMVGGSKAQLTFVPEPSCHREPPWANMRSAWTT